MSLFKLRDLWSTKCGRDEDFDQGSLLVADIPGEKYQQIIIGSHAGCLRIYNPQIDLESGEYPNFKPIDLLIEVQLEHPILQLSVGKFVSGSKMEYLAVLHPRSLAIYNFIAVSGSTEHGDQWEVSLVYQHQLSRSAYCLVVGGFGGVDGRDFVCVLALDGTLIFYEQETLVASRSLPGFLLPSPIVYVPHTDSFVLLSANWHLQSFRYQGLGEETDGPVLPSWSFNLGEEVVDMHSLHLTTTQAGIFLLTHRNFFCFTETGTIKFSKRLQYVPICSHIFSRGEPMVMSMIVTESKELLVYEDSKLLWAAQLHIAPVAVSRASLQVVPGCVIMLTEDGEVECAYLGTEAGLFVPPPLPATITAEAQLETKLAGLQHQLATLTHKEVVGVPGEKQELKVTGKVWPSPEGCLLEITLTPSSALHSINVALDCPTPLTALPQAHFIQNISESAEVSSKVELGEGGVPWDLTCTVVCAYLCGDQSGVSTTHIHLPLSLLLDIYSPVRGMDFTLNFTAAHILLLPAIFTDFSVDSWSSTGCNEICAGFRYKGRPEEGFTVSLNKGGLKYRLEGDSLAALTLPVTLLYRKLAGKHLSSSQYSLPLPHLFAALDRNLIIRDSLRRGEEELKLGCSQMRACQRRLLTKMRDKTPTDINPLSLLVSHTHDYIMEAAHKMEAAQKDLEENGYLLGNLIQLTMTLIKLSGTAAPEEVDNLHEAMSYTQHFSENQGWAEITQVALSHLLKTTLARSIRDQYGGESEAVATETLKKQVAKAIDRVVKGQSHHRGVSPIPEGEDEDGKTKDQELESSELKRIIEEAELNLDHL